MAGGKGIARAHDQPLVYAVMGKRRYTRMGETTTQNDSGNSPSGTPSRQAPRQAPQCQPESDVEYEVSSLRPAAARPTQAPSSPLSGVQSTARARLAPRLLANRPRRLLLGSLATVAILLLAALTLQGTIGQSHPDTSRLLPTAQQYLYFANGAGRGILLLDGRPLDEGSVEGGGVAVHITLGWHTIDYSAPPFPPLHCHITVPPAPGDSCPLLPYTASVKGPDRFYSGPGRVVNLRSSPAYLAPAQLAALASAVNHALTAFTSATTLATGDHYRSGAGQLHTASQPLIATLRFRLYVDPAHGLAYSANPSNACLMLCGADLPGSITANAVADWLYSSPRNGATLDQLVGTPDNSQQLTFALTWDNDGWIATFTPYRYESLDPDCAEAPTLLENVSPAFDLNDLIWNSNATDMAQGCLVGVPLFDAQGNKTTTYADFFMRCGALVAVNAIAQRDAPAIPFADSGELQTARSYYLPGSWPST